MSWSWEEIEANWLSGGHIALSRQEILAAFDRVERILGREWIEAHRAEGVTGALPTLSVAMIGRKLQSLEGVANTKLLIQKLQRRDASAFAELNAVYILLSRHTDVATEVAPETAVGDRIRAPDIRVRRGEEPWTYIEVTRPDVSEVQERVRSLMGRLTQQVASIQRSFALEVFLRREPADAELDSLALRIPEFCKTDGIAREEIQDLGLLLLNYCQPGQFVVQDHPGEEVRPMLGAMQVVTGGNEPNRHIVVRVAFSDDRADEFLKKEAKQLPTDAPGLIMIETSNATGAFRSWGSLLARRFQPTLHTRVGAVCLFHGGIVGTPDGEAEETETKLLLNPHAKLPLPSWIIETLMQFENRTASGDK